MILSPKADEDRSSLVLLNRAAKRTAAFASLRPRVVASAADLQLPIADATRDSIWVSYASDLTDALIKRVATRGSTLGIGLFVHALDVKKIPLLSTLFRRIAFAADGKFLPAEELVEVLRSPQRENLAIGGFVDAELQSVTLWRGNFESLTVPFSAFEESGDGIAPNFASFSVIDSGQTIKLGDYEAAFDAVLYEYDPEYRRAQSKQRLQTERTFGASLRRLRKQRGLRREDFEPAVSAKTIARIEQGKVTRVQGATLNALAKRLAVEPQEIASY